MPHTPLSHSVPKRPATATAFAQSATVNIAPRKPNWDLKRDLETKMALLNKRTRRAVRALIRTYYTPWRHPVTAASHVWRPFPISVAWCRAVPRVRILGTAICITRMRHMCEGTPSHRRVPSFRRHHILLTINIRPIRKRSPPPSHKRITPLCLTPTPPTPCSYRQTTRSRSIRVRLRQQQQQRQQQ